MLVEFTVSINCGPRSFNPGDRVAADEIAGYLDSLLRQRQAVEVPDEPSPPIAESKPPELRAVPKSTAKK